jgi:pSer/pThr/pTyr-binding forkhead associated (FHA) protein
VAARADGFHIRDLGSQNGTLVNGKPATDRPLAAADEVRVGEAVIIFSYQRRQRSA